MLLVRVLSREVQVEYSRILVRGKLSSLVAGVVLHGRVGSRGIKSVRIVA